MKGRTPRSPAGQKRSGATRRVNTEPPLTIKPVLEALMAVHRSNSLHDEPQRKTGAVSIRGGACRRRKNRPDDAQTIQLRRMIAVCEAEPLEKRDATTFAFLWAMERKLPRNQLRCITGTLDLTHDFELRLAELDVFRAERDLIAAKIRRVRILEGKEAAEAMYPENERCCDRYWQAAVDMANTPVFTKADLRRKRYALGVWLTAQGARYDQFRAAVTADETRLNASKVRE
jgi:hypothetical protein